MAGDSDSHTDQLLQGTSEENRGRGPVGHRLYFHMERQCRPYPRHRETPRRPYERRQRHPLFRSAGHTAGGGFDKVLFDLPAGHIQARSEAERRVPEGGAERAAAQDPQAGQTQDTSGYQLRRGHGTVHQVPQEPARSDIRCGFRHAQGGQAGDGEDRCRYRSVPLHQGGHSADAHHPAVFAGQCG